MKIAIFHCVFRFLEHKPKRRANMQSVETELVDSHLERTNEPRCFESFLFVFVYVFFFCSFIFIWQSIFLNNDKFSVWLFALLRQKNRWIFDVCAHNATISARQKWNFFKLFWISFLCFHFSFIFAIKTNVQAQTLKILRYPAGEHAARLLNFVLLDT